MQPGCTCDDRPVLRISHAKTGSFLVGGDDATIDGITGYGLIPGCNVYKELKFPDEVYRNVNEYAKQKANT